MYEGPCDLGFGPAQVVPIVSASDHYTIPQQPEKLARGKDKFLVTPPLSHSHKGTPQTIAVQEKTRKGFRIKKAKSTEKQKSPQKRRKKMPFSPLYENVWKWVGISSLSTTHTLPFSLSKTPLLLSSLPLFIYLSRERLSIFSFIALLLLVFVVKKICGAKGLLLPCFFLF